MAARAKKAPDKDATRRKRTKTFQRVRQQAGMKSNKSYSRNDDSANDQKKGLSDKEFIMVSEDEEDNCANGDPGPSRGSPLFVSPGSDSD